MAKPLTKPNESMKPIRTILVDDEPLGRERIRTLLKELADFELLAECTDGREAIEAVHEHEPDLIFLDVQMPELDGFEVIESLAPELRESMPSVIFVTAFDQYALRAFEVHALDYLLKPFDGERFAEAIDRARAQIARHREGDAKSTMMEMIQQLRKDRGPLKRFVVKSAGRVVFLRVEEIDWIEAAGNYLKIHVGADTHLLRETMGSLEKRLDPDHFVRIHRSTMVSVDRIRELQPAFHGDFVVILRDGTQLAMSRGYRDKLEHLIESA
jgi:two-component system LytT family response regulator